MKVYADKLKLQYPELSEEKCYLLAQLVNWHEKLSPTEKELLREVINQGSYVEEILGVYGKEV